MRKACLFCFLLVVLAVQAWGQRGSTEGIRESASDAKTITYQIRLEEDVDEQQATWLDAKMAEKEGILTAQTDASTDICTVRVLRAIRKSDLQDVVDFAGFSVAKSF